MKALSKTLMALALGLAFSSGASAAAFTLYDSYSYVDGAVTSKTPAVPTGGFSVTVSGTGLHTVLGYVDVEIDEASNTYFNEAGSTGGALASGQSWEIDEPGFGSYVTSYVGDIYTNFTAGALDGMLFDGTFAGPEDVAMALGWDFTLGSGETATVAYFLSEVMPTSGFYLRQSDPDSSANLYFYSTLTIQQGGQVPEPSTYALLGIALAGMLTLRRKVVRG